MKLVIDLTPTRVLGFAAVAGLEGEALERFKEEVEKDVEYNVEELKNLDKETYQSTKDAATLIVLSLISNKLGL